MAGLRLSPAVALAYWYGGVLVRQGEISLRHPLWLVPMAHRPAPYLAQ